MNSEPTNLSVSWKSPSNIAIIKYWGKYPNQIPANPSLSLSLQHCLTETRVNLLPKINDLKYSFEVWVSNKREVSFEPKIEKFLNQIHSNFPWLGQYHIHIETNNTFPHSSGIASSASGMSALALCFCSLHQKISQKPLANFFQTASQIARIGSGSAARSVYGGITVWGQHDLIDGSSQEYAIKLENDIHPVYQTMQDTILLVHKGSKAVSSSQGHDLMHTNPYASTRFKQAAERLGDLLSILKNGDLEAFMQITESEALTLHAMMMVSNPYFMLMKPDTLQILEAIWQFRKETNLAVFFTLDAGANVHLLYPEAIKNEAMNFIRNRLSIYCEDGHYICDQIGNGPEQTKL